ncbi:MAG: aminotransferase class V-fold PLP-dependent enzyme [Acidimicrobiia bacterium]|nr:aminotransferase class V-fold PLP-dependent enzyme [Acidimicrobiia bacterium]
MTRRRIGVWPSLPVDAYRRPATDRLPYPLDHPDCRLYERARQALWQGIRAMGLQPGDEVLVPAYHHGSEVEALRQAGLVVRYVDITPDMEFDPTGLEATLGPRTRVLYLIHFLGFPQDTARWRAWCDEHDLLLFEDAAQAWMARDGDAPLGTLADLAIYCMYKTVGIPDGAAVISKNPPDNPTSTAGMAVFEVAKRHGAWAAERNGAGATIFTPLSEFAKWVSERGVDLVAREFDLGDPESPPSRSSQWLLPRLADPTIPERRRANYRFLLDEIGSHVPVGFSELPDGASPFAFPIQSADGEALADQLIGHGVKALLLWKNPHPSLPIEEFPVARHLRDTVIALGVHQELTRRELQLMADVVGDILG